MVKETRKIERVIEEFNQDAEEDDLLDIDIFFYEEEDEE